MIPICLSVTRDGDEAPPTAHRFDQREVVIGRSTEVDLCLDDESVSLVHLRLVRKKKGTLFALDVDSTNGSWIDGVPLPAGRARPVAVGSRLVVGVFTVDCVAPSEVVEPSTASVARRAVQEVVEGLGQPPRLEVIGGPNRGLRAELPATGEPLVIGRTIGCGLRLTDADVSREHVEISGEGALLCARDLGSKNGFFHCGQRIVDSVRLAHGDELRLGATRLRLVVPSHLPRCSDEDHQSGEQGPADRTPAANRGGSADDRLVPQRRPEMSPPGWRDPTLWVVGGLIILGVAGAITYLAW